MSLSSFFNIDRPAPRLARSFPRAFLGWAPDVPARRYRNPPVAPQADRASMAELLGRPEVLPDRRLVAPWIAGARVLITGAGGSIGAELARHVASLGPARLIVLDHSEHALWHLGRSLAAQHPNIACQAAIADVRDTRRMRAIFAATGPDIVLHAAALKHVPMVEEHPLEGLLTNAIGTRNVIDAARAAGVRAILLLSTDKAVYPASVMGASKRLAELYSLASDRPGAAGSRCLTVRFGNVLGSSGSVLALWEDQLATGRILFLTHPDMRRYFVTLREAASLSLQALALGLDGTIPPGGLALLDMGAPMRITDLAERVIRAAGLTPHRDVRLTFTGARPGEKLSETLLHADEPAVPSPIPGLLHVTPRRVDAPSIGCALDELEALCRAGEERLALQTVSRLIPGFDPRTEGGTARLRA